MKPHHLVLAGFGAFAKKAEVDFDRLSEHGLYLIIGETGSGKTTIFDAMTFALFGEVAGNRDNKSVSSDFEDRDNPYVEFEFSHNKRNFVIKRVVEGTRPTDHSITEIDDHGKSLSAKTGKTEVKKFVEELIGLDADQFMKVVLLPQGKFQDFLVATSSEREELLQVLFGTTVYNKISDSLVERARRKVLAATEQIQQLKSNEIAAQQILDGLNDYGFEGEPPNLDVGYEVVHQDLQKRKSLADMTAENLGNVHTEAAKKLQAVNDDAEIFDASTKLTELSDIQQKAEKQVKGAVSAIDDHIKALPVSKANESTIEMNSKHEGAKQVLAKLDDGFSEIVRKNKSEKLISALSEYRVNGIASINAYIAQTKAKIEKARDKYAESLEFQEAADDALSEIESHKEREQEIKSELKEIAPRLKKTLAEQASQQAAVKKFSAVKTKVAAMEKLLEIADVSGAKLELKNADAEFVRASKLYDSARASLQNAHDLRTKHLAGELGSKLKTGEECLVCGSTSHPRKAKKTKNVSIESLEEKRTVAQTRSERAEAELKRCQLQLKKANEALKKLPAKETQSKLRTELEIALKASRDSNKTTKLVASLSKQVSALESESAALTADLKNQTKIASTSAAKAKSNLSDAKLIIAEERIGSSLNALSEVSKLIGKLDDAEKNVASALSKFQQATANSEKVLKESGFKSILIALESVLQGAQVASLKKVIKDADERLTTITGLKGRIEGKKIPPVRPDIASAKDDLAHAKASAELASKLSNGINQAINIVASLITAQATDGVRAKAELDFAKETLDIADKFKNGTNGRNGILGLERWVQRHLFREVCNVGNAHIRTLSKGRYELTLESQVGRERARAGGLDLYVMDAYNGKTRPVQSLSGGETFLVSLALALSLAEVVQSLFGGIELTSLFIDEGFGTLDGDTLESAVSLLESIRSDGRSIGVITHVDQMQETLPIGMKIHKTARGSSVEQMDALSVVG